MLITAHRKHWRDIVKYNIIQGDNRDTLRTLEDNSVDAVVTDPPYGIDFLGKDWDANTGALETYRECLRVLKPGGYILAFSAARTYHYLAVTLEQAGFEIRDQIMWLYASGFPKAQDIGKAIQRRQGVEEEYTIEEWEAKQGYSVSRPGETMGFGDPKDRDGHGDAGLSGKIAKCTSPEAKQWAGWKTHLKPAHEPICMARKPFKGSTIDNVLEHGLGALNIDATRIEYQDLKDMEGAGLNWNKTGYETGGPRFVGSGDEHTDVEKPKEKKNNINEQGRFPSNVIGEVEGYQKFFYCPKVSRKERHIGHELPEPYDRREEGLESAGIQGIQKLNGEKNSQGGNNHPTVKPVALMRYLIQLVTPPNSRVLDPFCGSGSTGMAAVELGHEFIGCELDPAYVDIAKRRIEAWNTEETDNTFGELFDYVK